jgi:dTDP-4-dehydrorhamnose 3,5-epimerase-like enzyme
MDFTKNGWKEGKIPAGKHTLVFGYSGGAFNHNTGRSVTIISGNNLIHAYDFQPGRKYSLSGYDVSGDKNIEAVIVPTGFLSGFTPPSTLTKFEGKMMNTAYLSARNAHIHRFSPLSFHRLGLVR